MREDMAKVLVERPRRGGGVKYPRSGRGKAPEDHAIREPIKNRRQQFQKDLNENLAPLRRFLRSRVGRPWDKVYSEICQRINRDSAVQLHIWQHLMWEVTRDPRQVAELLELKFRYRYREFYVHPRTGLLCEKVSARRERFRTEGTQPFLVEHGGCFYKCIDDIWYQIELAPLMPDDQTRRWDAILSPVDGKQRLFTARELRSKYGRWAHAIRKRQLNSKEIQWLLEAIKQKSKR